MHHKNDGEKEENTNNPCAQLQHVATLTVAEKTVSQRFKSHFFLSFFIMIQESSKHIKGFVQLLFTFLLHTTNSLAI